MKVQEETSMTQYFSLREGFDGAFQVREVLPIKKIIDKEEVEANYRVVGRGGNGASSLHGSLLRQSFVATTEEFRKVKARKLVKKGFKATWWYDDVQMVVGTRLVDILERDKDGEFKDFEYPEEIKILGAAVFTAQAGDFPMVPLFRYPGYNILTKYHRKLMASETARPNYAECVMYSELTGDARPKGLTDDFKFEVADTYKEDPTKWVFRLIIEDWRK